MRRPLTETERVWTVLDIVRWGTEYFEQKGIESPRLTIELLLCDVLKVGRLQLYTDHERPLTTEERTRLRAFVRRRADHEPLQYIVGTANFYGLDMEVDRHVLIPRPETELLVDYAIRYLRTKGDRPTSCLDIGTGSGCIPVTIAVHVPTSEWLGLDRSHDALDVAHRNAVAHHVADRCTFQVSDVLDSIPFGRFDLVTMNPPYIPSTEIAELEPEVKDHEPSFALTDGADGLTFYRRFAEVASDLLRPDGCAFLEIGYGQAPTVRELMEGAGHSCTILDDLAGIPRIVRIEPSVTKS